MSFESRLRRIENAVSPVQGQEPFLIVVRLVDEPGPSQEKIEAAMAEARQKGQLACIVKGWER